ncbi:MAG: sensor domain-containing diguanylate cyclase [Candidatus Omnitrophica bacterium]|nr:sensor domain-containing diguanylate cyclase [Candidatus Omnitrophota bacterium]
MSKKNVNDKINSLLITVTKTAYARVIFLLCFVFPALFLAVFNYVKIYDEFTETAIMQKRYLATLSSTIVNEKLNAIINLGLSFATMPLLVDETKKGDWEKAVTMFSNARRDYPFIERILIVGVDGVIKAAMPGNPVIVGASRAGEEWHNAVTEGVMPYVSDVYKEITGPRYNVIAAVIPIRNDPGLDFNDITGENAGRVLTGFLVVQIKLDIFSGWLHAVSTGPGGLIYIVDKKGRIVSHPRYKPQGEIIDFSSVPIVKKVMKGESNVELNYNPIENEERIAAYKPVHDYGWGIIVAQPVHKAFSLRDKTLIFLSLVYAVIIAVSLFLGGLILHLLTLLKKREEELEKLSLTDHLTGLYNRRGFVTLAGQELKMARRMNREMGLIFIDLDNMKTINDTLGHPEGDKALIDLAGILRAGFRESDIIARVGGDEFAVLVLEPQEGTDKKFTGRLEKNLEIENAGGSRRYKLSLSIGTVYCGAQHSCNINELLMQADKLMYQEKQRKKSKGR